MMHSFFLAIGIALTFLMALSLIRTVVGPTILDRILGGNVIGTKTTTLLLLIGLMYNDLAMFVDIALAYALLNFIATLGAAKFFLRRLEVFMEDSEREETS
jgi:multicomponent Na+:H+ antiporter subunit F